MTFNFSKPKKTQRIRKPRNDLNGILLIDKPLGISSNQALMRVRYLLSPNKLGHTGTLDPLATGMLPICLGEATKLANWMLGHRKLYRAVFKLGVCTDTGDLEGAITSTKTLDPTLTLAQIDAAMNEFRGAIEQTPPVYSAIKIDNEPAYRRARRGESVNMPTRTVMIYRFDAMAFDGDTLTVEVDCGAGTYIRSLAMDLGERLGCGAHVQALHRVWVEPFENVGENAGENARMIALSDFDAMSPSEREAAILPMEAGLNGWLRLDLDHETARRLRLGNELPWPTHAPTHASTPANTSTDANPLAHDHASTPTRAQAHAPDGTLVALVEYDRGRMRILRGLNVYPIDLKPAVNIGSESE